MIFSREALLSRRALVFRATAAAWLVSCLVSPQLIPSGVVVLYVSGFSGQGRFGRASTRTRPFRKPWQLGASSDSQQQQPQQQTVPSHFESISIEYCPGCRWMTKAFWMATELLQAFPQVDGVTVIPSEPGTFRINGTLATTAVTGKSTTKTAQTLWDRTVDGGFPPIDLIEFHQRVRDCLEDGNENTQNDSDFTSLNPARHVVIRYCQNSGHLLRAAYYGQELLTTFGEGELEAVSLVPSGKGGDGTFSVHVAGSTSHADAGTLLWETSETVTFPEVKKLKRLVRDKVTPQKDLGHSEGSHTSIATETKAKESECVPCEEAAEAEAAKGENDDSDDDDGFMDDDDAEEARRYFGVM